MQVSPIALFVYNRPEHTRQTVHVLQDNHLAGECELFIFSDAPKDGAAEEKVSMVREYLKTVKGFRKITVIKRDRNLGLSRSIITGVTELIAQYGSVIVLEDDMLTSRYFLDFINNALDLYKEEEGVASVSGFCYPIPVKSTYFIKGAEMWGWGTWKRAWDLFEPDANKLLKELKSRKLTYRFDMNGTVACAQTLKDQIDGIVSSWGIRWCASAFLAGKLNLYPPKTLIKNIGRDGSGTHVGISKLEEPDLDNEPIYFSKIDVKESEFALRLLVDYFYKKRGRSFMIRQLANKLLPKNVRVFIKKIARKFL